MILFVMKGQKKGWVCSFSFLFYFSRSEVAFDFEAFVSAGAFGFF